jgi:hypothetical protein
MAHHFHTQITMPRMSVIVVMILALLFPGCSDQNSSPEQSKSESPDGQKAATAPLAEKKVKKLRPGQQDPGSTGYEDKPGAGARGR